MPTKRMPWTHVWARGEPGPGIIFLSLNSRYKHETRLDMRQKEIELAWAKAETKSYYSPRIRGQKINSLYEANERQRVRQRAPAFHDSLVSFLLVHFLLVNTFFPILGRFTHISFKVLDFFYLLPLILKFTSAINPTL